MAADRAREASTPPSRRLRLGDLLRALGAREPGDPIEPRVEHLTVGELIDRAAHGGFAFLVALLSLIAIPFFGLSTPFGLLIALLGLQMLLGRTRPWLPGRMRRRVLSMTMLDRAADVLARRTGWLVRSTRTRHEVLVQPRVVGFGIVLLALGLALPLPIPGSNWVFLAPLLVYAVGILERDGVWIALGHLGLMIDLTLLIVFGNVVVSVLERVWRYLY